MSSGLAIRPAAGMSAYCAVKAGVVMLTRVLALELASYNIRVNALFPGRTRTAMTEHIWDSPEVLKQREAAPWGEPSDSVGAALFLASDASRYITGDALVVHGPREPKSGFVGIIC